MSLGGWIQAQTGLPLIPLVASGAIGLEWAIARRKRQSHYDARETGVSFLIAAGHRLIDVALAGVLVAPAAWFYRHRLFDIPLSGAGPLAALFLAVELAFYWQHRALHAARWFWASHSVHHSARRMNLSAALRLGWGGALAGGFAFYLPLLLIGFRPQGILAMLAISGLYQFFLHAAWAPRLGPLEWVLNTPRHHHVHHAANEVCLDRNFGGILIVFDRLFGTFAGAPAEPLRFGLAGSRHQSAGLGVLYAGWRDVLTALRRARSPGAVALALFGPPGLSADPVPISRASARFSTCWPDC